MTRNFIFALLLVAAVVGSIYYFLLPLLPPRFAFAKFVYIILFFVVTTAAFHYGLSRSAAAGTKHFIRFYMAATGAKLFIYTGLIMIYAVINKAAAMAFALCFLLNYVAFTTFEVLTAYRKFGSMKKEGAAADKTLEQ